MHAWIEINTNGRVMAFHDFGGSAISGFLPSVRYSALLSLGSLVRPSQVGGGASAPNMTATIENGDGRFTPLAADMIGSTAEIKRGGETVFSGIVDSVTIAETIGVQVVG